jgi:hypothetical protein
VSGFWFLVTTGVAWFFVALQQAVLESLNLPYGSDELDFLALVAPKPANFLFWAFGKMAGAVVQGLFTAAGDALFGFAAAKIRGRFARTHQWSLGLSLWPPSTIALV